MDKETTEVPHEDSGEVVLFTTPDPQAGQIVSREFRDMFEDSILWLIILINLFGIVANAINMRVFIRQGVTSDSTTIGLFALAMSDWVGCFSMLPPSFCFLIKVLALGDMVDYRNCQGFTSMPGHYTHVIFSRITCWLTVYISIERTLCVLIPLKVKFLIRPKVTKRVVVCIYMFWLIFHVPYAANTYIEHVYSEDFNDTIATVQETPLGPLFLTINLVLATTILTTVAMFLVTITTFILVYKLQTASKWRQSVAASSSVSTQNGSEANSSTKPASGKDKEVVKTVTTITAVFLATLVGGHVPAFAMVSIPGLALAGSNSNLFYTLYYFKFFLDSINSSINIIFYLKISSRYKAAFYSIYLPQRLEMKGY